MSDERVVSRSPVDIRAKLEEKKRLQLAELRDIEEELLQQRISNGYPQELAPAYLGYLQSKAKILITHIMIECRCNKLLLVPQYGAGE